MKILSRPELACSELVESVECIESASLSAYLFAELDELIHRQSNIPVCRQITSRLRLWVEIIVVAAVISKTKTIASVAVHLKLWLVAGVRFVKRTINILSSEMNGL